MPGYEFEALWRPAEETGGELFDVVLDRKAEGGSPVGGAALLLLDPDSFGVEAAVLSAQLRAVFRAANRSGLSPTAVAARLQSCFADDLRDAGVMRAWLGFLDAATGTVGWIAAGLGANLVHLRAGTGDAVLVASSEPALGAAPGHAFQPSSLELAPGDILAVVSNGIIDALNKERQRLGLAWLQQLLVRQASADAATLAREVDSAVTAFTAAARLPADRTVLLLKRL